MEAFRVPLAALRSGPIERVKHLEELESIFGELPIHLAALDIEFVVERDVSGGARARGSLRSSATLECRRCLQATPYDLESEFDAIFRPAATVSPDEEGIWALRENDGELDLTDAIREELWVSLPEYVECSEDCRGLCPRCGLRLADEACVCPPPGPDPRWAALDELRG